MELSEKKSKILVNPKKSDLMKESIREMLRLEVQNLQEKAKKKLDPVGTEAVSYTHLTLPTIITV